MDIDYEALLQSFLAESEEGLASMEEALMAPSEPGTRRARSSSRWPTTVPGSTETASLSGRALPGSWPPAARENVVVVEQARGCTAGLVVDALEGQSQAVIKPLAKLFRGMSGISGSTILPNGRVALSLDVPGLLLLATQGGTC